MDLGYARVSAKDQSPDRQLLKFKELGIAERFTFIDTASGKNFDRPKYAIMKNMIREGDLLYLDSLDRLGRDYAGIIREWKEITREIGADIVCLDNAELFDSRKFRSMGDIGNLLEDQMLSLLAYVADVERKKNLIRQREGIAIAKASGKKFGRPAVHIGSEFLKQYGRWKNAEITATQAYKSLGISKTTFYKKVAEHERSS